MPQKRYIVRLTAQEREVCQQTVRKLNGSSEKVRRAQDSLRRPMRTGRRGPTSGSRTVAEASIRAAPRPSRTFANAACRTAPSSGRWNESGGRRPRFPPTARRRTGGAGHRPASGATPEGLRELVVAPAGAPGRRVGDRRVDQPRNHPADAEKNGMTQRKIQYWVDPATGRCRVRGEHGTGPGPVSETLRSGLSRRVHGRAAGAVGQVRNPRADGGHEEPSCGVSTTSTNGPARPRSSCSANRWRVGGRRRPGPGVRRRTGRWRSPACCEGRYADCEKIALVCDNLNTHTKGAFYAVFEPTRARLDWFDASTSTTRRNTGVHAAEHRGERTQFR